MGHLRFSNSEASSDVRISAADEFTPYVGWDKRQGRHTIHAGGPALHWSSGIGFVLGGNNHHSCWWACASLVVWYWVCAWRK